MIPATNHDLKIKKRVQLVHIAANELGLLDPKKHDTDPEDEYHAILKRWNRPGTRQPVTSSLQMSYQQLGELLDFFTALGFKLKKAVRSAECGARNKGLPSSPAVPSASSAVKKKYESSIVGLKEEIKDLAIARWTESGWEQPLNNFCRRFGIQRWQWLDVAHGKSVKEALLRLQQGDTETPDSITRGQAVRGPGDAEKDQIPF